MRTSAVAPERRGRARPMPGEVRSVGAPEPARRRCPRAAPRRARPSAAAGSVGPGRLRGAVGPGRGGPGSPRPFSRARGRPEEGCAERRGPVPSPQKRPCAGPVIANHQSPLITADEAGGGGAFPGAGRAGGSGERCPAGAGAEGGTRP